MQLELILTPNIKTIFGKWQKFLLLYLLFCFQLRNDKKQRLGFDNCMLFFGLARFTRQHRKNLDKGCGGIMTAKKNFDEAE